MKGGCMKFELALGEDREARVVGPGRGRAPRDHTGRGVERQPGRQPAGGERVGAVAAVALQADRDRRADRGHERVQDLEPQRRAGRLVGDCAGTLTASHACLVRIHMSTPPGVSAFAASNVALR